MSCTHPPPGWYCTREEGHEGPCAALPLYDEAGRAYRRKLRRICLIGIAICLAVIYYLLVDPHRIWVR